MYWFTILIGSLVVNIKYKCSLGVQNRCIKMPNQVQLKVIFVFNLFECCFARITSLQDNETKHVYFLVNL